MKPLVRAIFVIHSSSKKNKNINKQIKYIYFLHKREYRTFNEISFAHTSYLSALTLYYDNFLQWFQRFLALLFVLLTKMTGN